MKLVEAYRTRGGSDGPLVERDATAEFERQREYMEAQMAGLRKQRLRREDHLRVDRQRKTVENVLLVQQVNELRQEKKVLQVKLGQAETEAKDPGIGARRGHPPRTAGDGVSEAQRGSTAPTSQKQAKLEPLTQSPRVVGGPLRTGRLHKGSTVSLRDLAVADPQRIAEIIMLVDKNNREMHRQQDEIKRLRAFVQHLLAKAAVADGTTAQMLDDLPGLTGDAGSGADGGYSSPDERGVSPSRQGGLGGSSGPAAAAAAAASTTPEVSRRALPALSP
eukprot:TRINITY_DN2874_c0_g1_i1.p3 TRINITY_DN2874_c0_g1~~TRINITY_DN2874_c0_g1_i1.p3  ORF type:complete len:277 (+),score=79.38 TRINITY_DN2874_c0_g1_i1:133-963(+)